MRLIKPSLLAQLLASGLLSQLLSISSFTVLAFVSTPAYIGQYSTLVSLSAILSSFFSLNGAQPILAAASETRAKILYAATAIVSTLLAALLLITLGLTSVFVPTVQHFVSQNLPTGSSLFIVLLALIQASIANLIGLAQRLKRLKLISIAQLGSSAIFFIPILTSLTLQRPLNSLELVFNYFFSLFTSLIILSRGLHASSSLYQFSSKNHLARCFLELRHNIRFILVGWQTTIFNTASLESPQVLISLLFGPRVAGLYAYAYKILTMSSSAFLGVASKYYYTKVCDSLNPEKTTYKLIETLSICVIPLLSSAAILSPLALRLASGDEWASLSPYLVLFCFPVCLWAISLPLTCWYSLRRVPSYQLIWNILHLASRLLVLWLIAHVFSMGPVISLAGVSLASSLLYLIKINHLLRLSGCHLLQTKKLIPMMTILPIYMFGLLSLREALLDIFGSIYSFSIMLTLMACYCGCTFIYMKIGSRLVDISSQEKA